MAKDLLARIRKNREQKIAIGTFTFVLRRPTDAEMVELHRGNVGPAEVAQRFVIGWEGVTENDVVGGGGSDPLVFDAALWREWCGDRMDFWTPLAEAAFEAYRAHAETLEVAAKN